MQKNNMGFILLDVGLVVKMIVRQAVVTCAFNPSTLEAKAGESLSLRPAWST